MEKRKVRVGISHGDINGIGYEVILKAFADPALLELCVPVVYGSPKVAAYHRKALGLNVNFSPITSAADAADGTLNLVTCFENEVKRDFGQATEESGTAAYLALDKMIAEYQAGLLDVVVTAPINKKTIQREDFAFHGHTEFLEARLGEGNEALMILMNQMMRVALVTTHLPIKEVAQAITPERLEHKIRLFHQALKVDFLLSNPRIAVLALNPHAGDDGLLGTEEKEIIAPVIQKMTDEGILCFGPYSADGFFGSAMFRHFDGILAMYHDQGLAPFKALSMTDGVNYTAGLPLVRTSPDHGTAYDLAGKGVADENSFRQAIYVALDVWRNRQFHARATANPLRKQYYDKRDDSDKVKHLSEEKD